MKTARQIALALGLAPTTLKRRLALGGIKADKTERVGNIIRGLYSPATVSKIKKLFKKNPVGSRVGRPAFKKRRK